MITANLLNSTASLNEFFEISALQFVPGTEITIVVRLKQSQRPDRLRYIPAAGSTLTLNLEDTSGNSVDITMTEFTDDRSMWSGTLTATQTETLAPGNIVFTLVEGGTTLRGSIQNGLQLEILGDC